ncbi:MAG: hypothetical protein IJX14_03165 [Clostridia bacterium]|nr:hypothetical protein [Clostridia bacterium]
MDNTPFFAGSFIHTDKSGTIVPLDENKQQIADKIQNSEYHTARPRPVVHTMQSGNTEQAMYQLCNAGFVQQITKIITAEPLRKLLALHAFFHDPAHIRNPVHPFPDTDFVIYFSVIFPFICCERKTVIFYPPLRDDPSNGESNDADEYQIQKAVKPFHQYILLVKADIEVPVMRTVYLCNLN